MSLILRNVKGSALTYTEGDANLLYLESLFTGATSGITLENTLIAGNTTGGNNIIMSAGDTIDSESGTSQLDLRYGGADNEIMLSTDGGNFTNGYMYMSPGFIELWADNALPSPNSIISTINLFTTGDGGINLDGHTTTTKNLKISTNFGLQFGAGPKRVFQEVEIGDWNMDADITKSVAHGLSATEYKTIRGLSVEIRDDGDTVVTHNFYNGTEGHINATTSTNINLTRTGGGIYDSTDFDSTSYNRGFITFWYTPDA